MIHSARFVGGKGIVVFSGELDLYNAPEVKEAILEVLRGCSNGLLVDLSGVEYIDSSGIGALIASYNQARQMKIDMKISGVTPAVRKVFELTRLTGFFKIFNSIDEALTSF